ncbi:MAG TPA: MlaD family protein, partial [Steroidobacteraceae bacterium]
MKEGKRHYRLGLFVVTSVLVLAFLLFVLGGRKLFQPTYTFETYFAESVAGLEVGSPLSFRGVPLGQVSEILTSGPEYEPDVPLVKRRSYIVVRAKVTLSAATAIQVRREAPEMVKLGLRAQTQLAGITGQQYLAVEYLNPAKNPPLEFGWTPKYLYVPSAPSATAAIIANVQ